MAIAIGIARHKIAQFRREREADPSAEALHAPIDHHDLSDAAGAERVLERMIAREQLNRTILAMLKLSPRCREILRLKLIEQKSYAEIRLMLGITGNIYETTKRCHSALLRFAGGGV